MVAKLGNGVVLGRLGGGFSGKDGMVVGFNDLDVSIFFAEEFLDGIHCRGHVMLACVLYPPIHCKYFQMLEARPWFLAFHSSEQNSIKFVNIAYKNIVHTRVALYWESPSQIAVYCISINIP